VSDAVVFKRPMVRIDLAGCYALIWERSPDAANRFHQAAEATLIGLAKTPGIGEPYQVANPQLIGLRCARVRRFKNYLILYQPPDTELEASGFEVQPSRLRPEGPATNQPRASPWDRFER
jgi:plasmid stabilization system protein ParE